MLTVSGCSQFPCIINESLCLFVFLFAEHGHSRLFITIPRFQEGIPITLGVVSQVFGSNNSVVHAYPSYFWQDSHGAQCDGITSVFRVFVSVN